MGRAVKTQSRSISPSRRYRKDSVSILSSLVQRDLDICLDIFDHRFLTTTQVFKLHFPSYSRARVRLHQLFMLGVLNRFRPPKRPGSWPWHYVLDRMGTHIVSELRDIEADKLYFRRNRELKLLNSPRLDHMRDVNEFFCRLVYASRQNKDFAVTNWLGEASSAALCQRVVRPDGVCNLRSRQGTLQFFFELDRGTENRSWLREKMIDYEEVAISAHLPKVLLFCFPTPRRERSARAALRSGRLTVATSILPWHLERPLEPIWLPLDTERRVSLAELASQIPSSPQLPVNVALYHSELPRVEVPNRFSYQGQGQ